MRYVHWLFAAFLPVSPVVAETPVPGIDGSWSSLACEVRPQVGPDGAITEWWLTREITFADGTITAEFTTYAAPGCQGPLNTLAFGGRVDVLSDSAVFPGAKEANLTIDGYVRFIPRAQGFADFLNATGPDDCGAETWVVGAAQDVLATGCSLVGVEAGVPTIEYEVLAVDGDRLYFGARPVDGTFLTTPEDRPTALLVALRRN